MGSERKWLVKSSDSILGPYEFDRVVENIFNGEIHLLDEIKGPFERWRPIKDHSLFAAAIEKLKAATYQPRENTMTATVDLGTKTSEFTQSQTITLTSTPDDTVTPEETRSPISSHPQRGDDQVSVASTSHMRSSDGALHPSATVQSSAPQKRFPIVFLLSFIVLVVGGATYLVYDFNQTRLIEKKISMYDHLTDVAVDSLKVGEYQRALKNFSRAYNISPQDPNLLIEMSPLSIQFDGKFDQTHARLEALLASNDTRPIQKLGANIVGLSYSYRERFSEALASFDASLKLDPDFLPALLNKSFALVKLKKFDEAVRLMGDVVRENPDEAITHYFYIRSLVEKGLALKDGATLKEVLSVSDQFSRKFADFRQEVLFLIAVVNARLGRSKEELGRIVDSFLRVDIELTKLHVHDTNIDFQSFNWLDFFQYCGALEKGLTEYKAKMLRGFCLLKVNNPLEAKKIFEALMSQNSTDGVLQALYASTLLAINDVSQAKNAFGFIDQIDYKQPVIETILRGCLIARDLGCGDAIFKGPHAKHISLLYSHWGNSEINLAKNKKKAKSSMLHGLSISPHFAPLLKLRRKIQ